MQYAFVLLISALVSFFVHDYLDRKYIGIKKRNIRLVIWGIHFHHSFFGALIILLAVIFTSGGVVTFACFGYGMGNIWQHKITHNRVNQKGMVFISRTKDYNNNVT